jgi:hypothetical protein
MSAARRGRSIVAALRHQAEPAGDNAPNLFARFRMLRERCIVHALLDFEPLRLFRWLARNRFVNVSRHKIRHLPTNKMRSAQSARLAGALSIRGLSQGECFEYVRFMKAFLSLALLVFFSTLGRADIIECDNGDRYHGKVLSMDEQKVVLKNDIAGTLQIPRARIVTLSFRDKAVAPAAARVASTNSAVLRPGAVSFDQNAVQKVQNEMLAGATPEANQMFNEMVQGLMSGQMDVTDIRRKAQSTLQELRSLQKELGDDETAALLNSYGAVLESFLKQAPARPSAAPAKPTAVPVQIDEE